jgi:hypothetical protein
VSYFRNAPRNRGARKTCKCGAPRRASGNDCLACNAARQVVYRAKRRREIEDLIAELEALKAGRL